MQTIRIDCLPEEWGEAVTILMRPSTERRLRQLGLELASIHPEHHFFRLAVLPTAEQLTTISKDSGKS